MAWPANGEVFSDIQLVFRMGTLEWIGYTYTEFSVDTAGFVIFMSQTGNSKCKEDPGK